MRSPSTRLRMRLLRFYLFALCLVVFFAEVAWSRNGDEPLNHYALITLKDEAAGQRLAGRFKAKGQPVFLVHDLASGLTQGDIMRFQDKAVLINSDVWQTLQAEKALEGLQASPLIRVTAKGSEATWSSRAKQVKSHSEQMAYSLGAELIKVLQENFGGLPSREQFVMTFDGANLQLMAPREFLDQLKVISVVKAPITGRPRFISPGPQAQRLAGQSFSWQAMAVDPAEPDGGLRYKITSPLPASLTWNAETHVLSGRLDSTGVFPVTAEVRNPQGAMDTVSGFIRVEEDRAPVLAQSPKLLTFAGAAWQYSVLAADPDHPGDSLRVLPLSLPSGMRFDTSHATFTWTPPDSAIGAQVEFAFRLQDPLQRGSDYRFNLQVRKGADITWSKGIHIDLPFDTLLQGKTYTWRAGATAAAWASEGVHVHAILGPDSTTFDGETLTLRPMEAGVHELKFQFETPAGHLQQSVALTVREDRPPLFLSSLSTARISVGQNSSYKPVAIDPENAPVEIVAEIPQGSDMQWDQGHLNLEGLEPGLHAAKLTATDVSGQRATQWIAVQVDPAARGASWTLENRMEGGISTWSATADFGAGRMGLYTPKVLQAFSFTTRSGREWPYVFFGGNLLSHASELRGNRLFTDLGFSLRLPDPKIATGGVYGRLCGEWTFPNLAFSRIETEFTGHVRQALVLTDTTGIKFIFGAEAMQFSQQYDPIIRRIVRDATAKDNAAFFTRLEAYSKFGWGVSGGPGAWREDFPMAQRYFQRLGAVARYEAHFRGLLGQFNMRSGWGPGGAGWDLYATWKVSFGEAY